LIFLVSMVEITSECMFLHSFSLLPVTSTHTCAARYRAALHYCSGITTHHHYLELNWQYANYSPSIKLRGSDRFIATGEF
jgi:hypothetical protein